MLHRNERLDKMVCNKKKIKKNLFFLHVPRACGTFKT